ncbi:MAG: hypothetical protein JO260_04610 [Acidobacteria bacterium]|nr:hypothetical protein [Acidobacteriota bacterium]
MIPQGASVERTKAQLAEYRRFRQLIRELITVSEQICSVQLREAQAAPLAKIKKNLFGDLLAMDVVQEIETLCWGARPWRIWILRPWKWRFDSKFCNSLEGPSNNGSMPMPPMPGAHAFLAAVAGKRICRSRRKQFHSVLGSLWLKRAYYHCQACGHGYFPRDRHLGMENTSLSPALTRMTGTVGPWSVLKKAVNCSRSWLA